MHTHTRTHTKLTCSDWVFTALNQVVGSKQQLPQKQNSKAKKGIKCLKNAKQSEHVGKCTENAFVHSLSNLEGNISSMMKQKCKTAVVLQVFLYTDDGSSAGRILINIIPMFLPVNTLLSHIIPTIEQHTGFQWDC